MINRNKWRFFLSVIFLIIGILNVSAANITLEFPSNISTGQMFDVNVIIDPEGEFVAGTQLDLEFDKSSILINNIKEGNFLKQSGKNTIFNKGTIDNNIGKAANIYGAILGNGNVITPGKFLIINATAIQSINTNDITITNVLIIDPAGKQIYPIPTPKSRVQTEGIVAVSSNGKPGGDSGEALNETTGSNKTFLFTAFVGFIIILILVYKYVIKKYL